MTTLGNSMHQHILQSLVELCNRDADIKAFGVFGSITRGDWDAYSDLDLDAIVADSTDTKILAHVEAMKDCLSSQGTTILLTFEEDIHQWVFILESLDRLSIRFHTLEDTSPNIIDSLSILAGRLTKEQIAKAAAVTPQKQTDFNLLQHKFLEHALYVPIYLHRGEIINAYNMLNTLRNSLISIYCKSHDLPKIEKFEKNAPQKLIDQLISTFGSLDVASIRRAYTALMLVYIQSIEDISSHKLHASDTYTAILEKAMSY